MYYEPDHFELYELLPKDFYHDEMKKRMNANSLWGLFDDRILWTIVQLRKRYGKMSANTWWWGREHQYRGWRPFDCGIGAEFSQHKFGRGEDVVPTQCTAEEVRDDILCDPYKEEFKFITCVEDFEGMSWVHVDCRPWQKNRHGILIVGK